MIDWWWVFLFVSSTVIGFGLLSLHQIIVGRRLKFEGRYDLLDGYDFPHSVVPPPIVVAIPVFGHVAALLIIPFILWEAATLLYENPPKLKTEVTK